MTRAQRIILSVIVTAGLLIFALSKGTDLNRWLLIIGIILVLLGILWAKDSSSGS